MGFRFIETMLRASISPDRRFRPYFFYQEDKWTEEEITHIHNRVTRTHPAEVDSMYNNWCFSKYEWNAERMLYSVRRSTWEYGDFYAFVLDEILDAVDLDGGHLTVGDLPDVFPDAVRITMEEAIAHPLSWYKEKPEYQLDYYQHQTGIWLINRPHLIGMLHTYRDPNDPKTELFRESSKFIRPSERNKEEQE